MTNNKYDIDLTSLFEELGLGDLTQEQKDKYSEEILNMLEDRVAMRLEDFVEDDDMDKLESMDEEQVAVYFDSKGVNIAEIAAQEALSLREELISTMSFADGVITNLSKKED
jgi:hypothetical protein